MELTKDLKALIVDYVKKFLKNYIPPRKKKQKQACSYANVSPGTLNDWVKSKGLKVILLEENSNPKYDIKDIDEFMKKYKV